jgi:hypothetical protein
MRNVTQSRAVFLHRKKCKYPGDDMSVHIQYMFFQVSKCTTNKFFVRLNLGMEGAAFYSQERRT